MNETLHLGDICTVRVPMRRPLLRESTLDTGNIEVADQVGVVVISPGHDCAILRFVNRDLYTLCLTASGIALIATGDLKINHPIQTTP